MTRLHFVILEIRGNSSWVTHIDTKKKTNNNKNEFKEQLCFLIRLWTWVNSELIVISFELMTHVKVKSTENMQVQARKMVC